MGGPHRQLRSHVENVMMWKYDFLWSDKHSMFVFTLKILMIQALLYHCVYLGRLGEERMRWEERRGERRRGERRGGGWRWKGKGEEGRGEDENDYKELVTHTHMERG